MNFGVAQGYCEKLPSAVVELFFNHFEVNAIVIDLEKCSRFDFRFVLSGILLKHGLKYPFCTLLFLFVIIGWEIEMQRIHWKAYIRAATRSIAIFPGMPIR